MGYYLILDKSPERAYQIQNIFKGLEDFQCLAVINSIHNTFRHLEYTPELVLINLDDFESNISGILSRIKKTFGLMPKLIGITKSFQYGYKALKLGFWEVIGPDMQLVDLLPKLLEYNVDKTRNIFCIASYQDFRYICINDLILLQADNRTTDFILKDGGKISGFNTLKYYDSQLPRNFVRINRSYIINAYAVRRINYLKKQIQLAGYLEQIPFTKHYLEEVDKLRYILAEC